MAAVNRQSTLLLANDLVLPIIRHHRHYHKRMDGSGYPGGLRDEQIPLTARILSVVYDARTTDRPYRQALPSREALGWDGSLVEAFEGSLEVQTVAGAQQP
jgi:HD-GYP domain-containing protein (c-di-GMP phosphodiesterase class II)